ncbi:SsgA family sporulation/cell division regulator [Phytoactinopolyspora halotolerans]|uniref:SsgA family sporulation/cell division regulator n=1 Tax=Phytoactinopolyspora halotolerans TaxID=1981512 RepID=A0A6L9SED8_9ACTN|nr:SsgA family sporulation/cell division regulator [Phytoactinopolyspora halotolerans]NEE02420.1 SsgA family sporulation/cell division regulator [Phytoactinopolyspora halotolerans]
MEHMVSHHITLRLITDSPDPSPLPADFEYHREDPLAVTVIFGTNSEAPVRWVFARDLLSEGLDKRTGVGDVTIWPVNSPNALPTIQIQLSSPDGDAYLRAPAEAIEAFLAETWRLVPPGTEGQHLDIDLTLDALLDGA